MSRVMCVPCGGAPRFLDEMKTFEIERKEALLTAALAAELSGILY
jgi:hypothetical protein